MNKKLFVIVYLAASLILIACGSQSASSTPVVGQQPPQTPVATQPTQAPEQPTETLAPSPAATVISTPQPAETSVPTEAPTPTARPTQRPPKPTPTLTPEVIGRPERLIIDTPDIKVDAAVEHVGLTPDGAMDVPKAWENVAWYELGPRPGSQGNAVMAGHLDSTTGPAVFWDLKNLDKGDIITVVDENGKKTRFEVTSKQVYDAEDAPIMEIFGPTEKTRLNLITCEGYFDRSGGGYDKRLVVFSERIQD